MDALPQSDVTRMAMAIEQEVVAKIKEIKLRAVEKYERTKQERIKEGQLDIARQVAQEERRLSEYRARVEGTIRNEYKKRVLSIKRAKLEEIFSRTRKRLKGEPLTKQLVEECLETIGPEKLRDFYVATRRQDEMEVVVDATDREAERDSWRELPECAIGGVVLIARDGRLIADNSYETRLKGVGEKHLQWVNRAMDW